MLLGVLFIIALHFQKTHAADDQLSRDADPVPAAVAAFPSAPSTSDAALLSKDIQALTMRMDMQDKQLDRSIALFNTALTVLGLVLAIGGFGAYFSVQRKATKEAREASQKWFDDHISELLQQAEEAKHRMSTATSDVEQEAVSAKQKIQLKLQSTSGTDTPSISPLPRNEVEALRASAQALLQKPLTEYTFDNWNTLAFAAYQQGDKEAAAFYWLQAARYGSVPIQIAQALFNRAIILGELGRNDDAIKTYDELIQRYVTATEPVLREAVAKALLNKGVTLRQLEKLDDAIKTYDELIQRYVTATEPVLREAVAKAFVSKGIALELLNKREEAKTEYREVIQRFGTAKEDAIQAVVAEACEHLQRKN
jgi:tetratricopeptide (TPR) repeat protein